MGRSLTPAKRNTVRLGVVQVLTVVTVSPVLVDLSPMVRLADRLYIIRYSV